MKKKEKNEEKEEEEGKVEGITILNFLTFCKSTIIKKHNIGKRIARKSTQQKRVPRNKPVTI